MAPTQDPTARPATPETRQELRWTRRRLLAVAGGITGATVAGGLAAPQPARGQAPPPPQGEPAAAADAYLPRMPMLPPRAPLVPPVEARSRRGLLSREIEVVQTIVEPPGTPVRRLTLPAFDRRLPGPTLRLAPGERLELCVYNLLTPNPEPAWVADPNCPHHHHSLNLHFHGLAVATTGTADNPAISIPPGSWQRWELQIPADHPGGTHWYHPLHHGSTLAQLTAGLAGALIVTGDFDAVPEIAAARDQVMLLQEIRGRDGGPGPFVTVDGQLQPVIRARPGEVQRWRLIHGGAGLTGSGARLRLERHRLPAIARDGLPLATLEDDDNPLLPVGGRLDVLVRASFERGIYPLVLQRATPEGAAGEPIPVAFLEVMGDPRPMELPAALPPLPPSLAPLGEPAGRRTVSLGLTRAGDTPRPTVDGAAYQPGRIDHRAEPGTVEEWRIENTTELHLPVHLPGQPLEVHAVTGSSLPAPRWQDTVWIPAGGAATLRVRFDRPGVRLLHTTLAELADRGLKQAVRVGETPPPAGGPCGEAVTGCR